MQSMSFRAALPRTSRPARPRGRLLGVLVMLSMLIGWGGPVDAGDSPITIPDFTLKDLKGRSVSLHDELRQGPVLVSFWATWCKPCLVELPHIDQIHEEWSEKGLRTLAISIDKSRSMTKVRSHASAAKYQFQVLLDPNQQAFRRLQGQSVPYVVLLDSTGERQYVKLGYRPGDEKHLEAAVAALLKDPASAAPTDPEAESASATGTERP